ncbi:MAG: hypothetical protein P8016_11545 [Sedimentisphaerales bacterium]
MKDEKGLTDISIGICVIGCIVAGVTAIYGGIIAINDHNDFIGAGICLASAALCFGVILIATLRK